MVEHIRAHIASAISSELDDILYFRVDILNVHLQKGGQAVLFQLVSRYSAIATSMHIR